MISPSRWSIDPVTVTTQVVSTPTLKSPAVWPTLEGWSDWLLACGETNRAGETPVAVIAARFHKGLTMIIAAMVDRLATQCATDSPLFTAVALSGGYFQNKVLLEEVSKRLSIMGYDVLNQSRVPANDGGLALGQAVIAAAQHLGR